MPIEIDQDTLQAANEDLGINVPIYNAREQGPRGRVRFDLYGHFDPEFYFPPEVPLAKAKPPKKVPSKAKPPDDLTLIPGVGKATAQALTKAGFDTQAKLRAAPDEALLDVVNRRALDAIRAYLKEHHPQ